VFYQMGRFDDAARELERAVKLTGEEDPIILEHLGDAYRRAGRLDDAHRAYGKSRELAPNNAGIREKIEELDGNIEKELDEAVRFAKESPFPDPGELTRLRARTSLASKNPLFRSAIRLLFWRISRPISIWVP